MTDKPVLSFNGTFVRSIRRDTELTLVLSSPPARERATEFLWIEVQRPHSLQVSRERNVALFAPNLTEHTDNRKHCANRTHRIRSTLKATHGRGRDFKKLPAVTSDNIREGQCVPFFSRFGGMA